MSPLLEKIDCFSSSSHPFMSLPTFCAIFPELNPNPSLVHSPCRVLKFFYSSHSIFILNHEYHNTRSCCYILYNKNLYNNILFRFQNQLAHQMQLTLISVFVDSIHCPLHTYLPQEVISREVVREGVESCPTEVTR